jgi:hypothetical protein
LQFIIEEGNQNFINGVIVQLQKEKEDNIQGHQKSFEEVKLLDDVYVKYEGIISKARIIKSQEKRIEYVIIFEKKIDGMSV